MEGDPHTNLHRKNPSPFQSTPSVWRETRPAVPVDRQLQHFNPLPPYGGRRCCWWSVQGLHLFQSTPSVWRETGSAAENGLIFDISIHSLRMEGDEIIPCVTRVCKHFNPLPPYGGRPELWDVSPRHDCIFQSTPSVWRETSGKCYFRRN